MSTLGQVKARVARELDRTDLATEISDAIQSALIFYRAEHLYFNESRATMDTSAGQSEYPLPDDYVGMQYIMCTANSRNYKLNEYSYQQLDELTETSSTAEPVNFAIWDTQIHLDPIPDDVYPLRIVYVREITLSASDSAVNAWLTEAEELIRLHTKVDLLINRIRGPEALEEAKGLRALEVDMLGKLKMESTQRKHAASGRIVPTKF